MGYGEILKHLSTVLQKSSGFMLQVQAHLPFALFDPISPAASSKRFSRDRPDFPEGSVKGSLQKPWAQTFARAKRPTDLFQEGCFGRFARILPERPLDHLWVCETSLNQPSSV